MQTPTDGTPSVGVIVLSSILKSGDNGKDTYRATDVPLNQPFLNIEVSLSRLTGSISFASKFMNADP